jgi:hypothetical protein
MLMNDLRCQKHDVPLAFVPEDSEYVCTVDDSCPQVTLSDILRMVGHNVGFLVYN